jgi:mannose-6-phosphate isomerase-like protein (cupin superfamily)
LFLSGSSRLFLCLPNCLPMESALPFSAAVKGSVASAGILPGTRDRHLQTIGEENMVQKIGSPAIIEASGNKPKIIEEFFGRVNTRTESVSIARMKSPCGWIEPGQTPEFDEFTVVLKGMLRVETRGGQLDVMAGEAVVVPAKEWVQYSTPGGTGAEYIAVCQPAFSPESVHRDEN